MPAPEPGQLVVLRSRPGVVRDVASAQPTDGDGQAQTFVTVDYIDGDQNPETDTVVWQRESQGTTLSSLSFPVIDDRDNPPSRPEAFSSLLDSLRWASMGQQGILRGAGIDGLVAPLFGAVQVEDYQLHPVLKAMSRPRIELLLADDVGLGKTIEAGLIATELIARRRIRRILIICPASLQIQWQEEMHEKFTLDFTILDRDRIFEIQRTLGMDANPWLTTPRVITSMDFLRQPDVQEDFMTGVSTLQRPETGSPAWDLLIVDEAHNFMPSAFGTDSQRCRMLRKISPHFEHRLLLTATPHNGHTASFAGLLELLSPVRFQQKHTLAEDDHRQIEETVVRRLKSELNERGAVKRFPKRIVRSRPVEFGSAESELFAAVESYRRAALRAASGMDRRDAQILRFLVSILVKRLLSSSYAFARSWWSHVVGYDVEAVSDAEVANAVTRAQADLDDDVERGRREEDAVRQGAAWLRGRRPELAEQARAVNAALEDIGWTPERLQSELADGPLPPDARWDALRAWIEEKLRQDGQFRDDERAIIFTEYKDTLDYLLWRLEKDELTEPVVQHLFGGVPSAQREVVKEAFNDPTGPVRMLVATDVASEGLNLQTSCRYVFNQDIPWNPMRLDQRIGRVDRHGQGRDVYAFHFTSDEQADLRFLDHVARKVDQVREDLGNVGEIIDETTNEHFTKQAVGGEEFERRVDAVRDQDQAGEDYSGRDRGSEEEYRKAIQAMRAEELRLGLNEQNMAQVLRLAMAASRGQLEKVDGPADQSAPSIYRIQEVPPGWEEVIDRSVRIRKGPAASALPKLVFDPDYFIKQDAQYPVFRPRPDVRLIRLGHPLMRRAIGHFRRQLWEKDGGHWTIVGSELPGGTDAILILHALCSATSEAKQTIHEEVRSWPFIVEGRELAPVDEAYWLELRGLDTFGLSPDAVSDWHRRFRELWLDHEAALKDVLRSHEEEWTAELSETLDAAREQALEATREAYAERIAEIGAQDTPRGLEKLRRELIAAEQKALQRTFDEEENRRRREHLRQLERELSEAEWQRQHSQLQMLKEQLETERDRLLDRAIPKRYSLARVDVQPIGVEYRVRARR
ncbi:MAG: DISARM system SNF2-like helicase DrmD [Armatimonadota bacterium]